MTVGEFCNRQVVIARRGDTILEAARRIRDFHVGTLVVVDEGDQRVPVGILTDRDIVVGVIAENRGHFDALTVGGVMTRELVTAREDENLLEALKKMRSYGVRRLPVVNAAGGLEGIMAFDDVVELVAQEMTELTQLVSRERKRESEVRA